MSKNTYTSSYKSETVYSSTVTNNEDPTSRKFNWPDLDTVQIPKTHLSQTSGLTSQRKEKLRKLVVEKQSYATPNGSSSPKSPLYSSKVTSGGPSSILSNGSPRNGYNGYSNGTSSKSINQRKLPSSARRPASSRRRSKSPKGTYRRTSRSPTRKGYAEPATEEELVLEDQLLTKEHEVKSLQRDKQVLRNRQENLKYQTGKQSKTIDDERRTRVRANIKRHEAEERAARIERQYKLKLARLRQIDDVWAALDEAFMALEKQSKQIEVQGDIIDQLKKENESLSRLRSDHEAQINALTKEKHILTRRVEELQAHIEKLQRECEAQRALLQQLKNENAELDANLRRAQDDLNKAQMRITELEVDKSNLRAQVGDLNDALSSIRRQRDQLDADKTELSNKLASTQAELAQTQQERENYRIELEARKADVANLRLAVQERDDEINRLKDVEADLERAKLEIDKLQQDCKRFYDHENLLRETIKKMCETGQSGLRKVF